MNINRQSLISYSVIKNIRHIGFLSTLLILLLLTCKESTEPDNGFPTPTWIKSENNPVLKPGQDGSWDDASVELSSVHYDGSIYKMWYAGNDGLNYRIGYATSEDGITWIKYSGNPVLDIGNAESWDNVWVIFPSVFFDGTKYHMWYHGNDGSNDRIGYATSSDGINWDKHANNPVLDLGTNGSWDDRHVGTPFVYYDGTTYHMWYAGGGSLWSTQFRIGYATSENGIDWDRNDNNPVLDVGSPGESEYPRVQDPMVIHDGNQYQMWYAAGEFFTWRIFHATSPDGITWIKKGKVLSNGDMESWDNYFVSRPWIIYDGETYQMWYTGGKGQFSGSIGHATYTPE